MANEAWERIPSVTLPASYMTKADCSFIVAASAMLVFECRLQSA